MSFAQTTTLPSISHLLNGHPSSSPPLPPRLQTTPAFNLSPASPVSSHPPSSPPSLISSIHSPQSSNNDLLHPLSVNGSSPLLSPVDSCKSPLTANASLSPRSMPAASVSVVDDLPPLQGYDPPVRKFSSSNTLHPPTQIAPWSSRDHIHNTNTTTLHVSPPPASPVMNTTSSSRNNSIASSSSNSNTLSLPSPAMSPCQEKKQPSRSMRQQQQQQQSSTPAPPSTQIIISPTGQPILKRRRGRPPSNREPQQEGGWTFLTPTVWDVKQTATPVIGTCASNVSSSTTTTPSSSSTNGTLPSAGENNDMQGSMAAFTSSTMETVLQMPRKKRGRKPKTHIEGNSCFVWRDLPCTRSPSRSSKKIKRSD
ncbi:hypothetical protein O0I10_000685 [Lichtheimia ornata]|uniref:Uncharacterized protein n=1 Tax=Lichtheimia ornata TaxID=688661 RepID=A0AAD7Y449_9FUNG|nr:uncharacterized protein O0I10_000685 [Lichtheimia ornata]KAJ8663446.1 hypothetical protein O0I10_000685 [Lichtheimia ornata]